MNEKPGTLFVHTRGISLRLEGNVVRADRQDEAPRRMPLLRLCEIVLFGSIHVSTALIHRCADDGIAIVWMDGAGRFKGRLQGPTRGNVLVRSAQHAAQADPPVARNLACRTVKAKIEATAGFASDTERYRGKGATPHPASEIRMARSDLMKTTTLDEIRGLEGITAKRHFENLAAALTAANFPGRSRRPPTDPVNAVLSFVYALLATRCTGAAEATGLDPYIGFLHTNRPGRPGLALDLMEPFRPLVDRIVVTMFNKRMVDDAGFERHISGACTLTEDGRRAVIDEWVRCTEREILHPTARMRTTIGMAPLVEARVLARILREESQPDLRPMGVF